MGKAQKPETMSAEVRLVSAARLDKHTPLRPAADHEPQELRFLRLPSGMRLAQDATVGFGTALCVWAGVFGYSLSQLVDGTREGFLNTCCTIHQGHYPCNDMEQYQNRKRYWGIANTCLGAIDRARRTPAPTRRWSTLTGRTRKARITAEVCVCRSMHFRILHFCFGDIV